MRLNIAKAKAFYAQVRLVRIINLTVILHTVLRDGALWCLRDVLYTTATESGDPADELCR